MTSRRLGVWLTGALCLVLVVLVVDSSGIVSDDTAVIVDDGAQLAAGVAATLACWWGARRTRGAERGWRTLMALGMGGWSAGMAVWSWYQIVLDTPLPCPSVADVGFLTMPVMALPALLALGRGATRHPHEPQRRASLVDVLDGLVVVGSLFVMAWATALGSVVRAEAPSTAAFLVALAYPATDLMLVVIVMLVVVTRRVPDALRTQVWLLGAGLVAISVSDSIFAYLISVDADEMPPLTNAGFIAGPLLIAIAGAAVAPAPVAEAQATAAGRRIERAHLLLPYALVGLTGTVIAVQAVGGARIDAVEAVVAFGVVALVLVRQMITLVQNTALLEHVSAARAQLAHEAHHDPLTGLANRALFGESLERAVRRHRDEARRFALVVVDLDDFKAVNDTLGHSAGDRVLHAVGGRLRGCVRGSDTVARLGGDEFAVVLDAPPDEPRAVAERILHALRQPFEAGGTLVTVTASVGVVEPPGDEAALTPDAVMHRADAAMYVGKRRGKDTAVVDGSDGSADLTTTRG